MGSQLYTLPFTPTVRIRSRYGTHTSNAPGGFSTLALFSSTIFPQPLPLTVNANYMTADFVTAALVKTFDRFVASAPRASPPFFRRNRFRMENARGQLSQSILTVFERIHG